MPETDIYTNDVDFLGEICSPKSKKLGAGSARKRVGGHLGRFLGHLRGLLVANMASTWLQNAAQIQ